jgi:2-keto-4-pentenoate hydratase
LAIDVDLAVEDFWQARQQGVFFPPSYFDKLTIDEGYRIQLGLVDRRVAAGEKHIGWKVGLTAKAIQEQLGFHEPVFACVLETQPSGYVFGANQLINPSFETELCIRLGRALRGSVSYDDVRAAIDAVYPSFEIIETRGPVQQMAIALADNGQQRTVILGQPIPIEPNTMLSEVAVRVELNGKEVAAGPGSAVLGDPLNSIVWLAGKLDAFGRHLREGDLIMTGSFVRQFPMNPGDVAVAKFSEIGEVSVRMAVA